MSRRQQLQGLQQQLVRQQQEYSQHMRLQCDRRRQLAACMNEINRLGFIQQNLPSGNLGKNVLVAHLVECWKEEGINER